MAAQSCTGANCVPIQVTVPQSMSLTVSTQSVNLGNLTPGANWNGTSQPVNYTVTSNDGSGDYVTVQAASDLIGQKNSANTIPAGDIGVWGSAQNTSGVSGLAGSVTFPDGILPAPLPNNSGTPLSTSKDAGPVASRSGTDNFAFLGGVAVMNGNQAVIYSGKAVPTGTPADTYASILNYTLVGN